MFERIALKAIATGFAVWIALEVTSSLAPLASLAAHWPH